MPCGTPRQFGERAPDPVTKCPDDRTYLLAKMPKGAACAEIGVWKGEFSRRILDLTAPRVLHLIDPWEFRPKLPHMMYGGLVATGQADMDAIHDGVVALLSGDPAVRIHRARSAKTLAAFPDNVLDWIYIDGNHHYEPVLEDLRMSRRVVRPGGRIAGDDYTWGEAMGFPVRRAVLDFAKEEGLAGALEQFGSQFIIHL